MDDDQQRAKRRCQPAVFLFSVLSRLSAVLWCLSSVACFAQTYPTHPIQVIVPFAGGSASDVITRVVLERMGDAMGRRFIVDNRPGAGGNTGTAAAARAEPDGYTLLMSGSPTHSVGPHLFKHLTYDPMRDVPPVAMMAVAPNLLVVNAAQPVKSLQDLIRLAREKPGQLTYSSAGNGTSGHLAAELLKNTAGLEINHVPFKTGPDAATAVLSGEVTFVFFTVPSVLPQVEAGKLRALAITSARRSPLVPDVPTVAELGFPGFEVLGWYALFAPRGTPSAIVERLNAEIEKIVALPEIRNKMAQLGMEPRYLNPQQLTDFVAVESPKWGRLLQEAGVSAD
jgi:tripartite-type tricarboxylate transporter receptor subunit TctC